MECSAHRFDAETIAPTSTKTPVRRGRKPKADAARAPEADPSVRAEFEAMDASIRQELAPRGVLETICVDRAIVAAWRLREAISAERSALFCGGTAGVTGSDVLGRLADDLRRRADRAERSLRRALKSLRDLRETARGAWGLSAPSPSPVILDGEPDAAVVSGTADDAIEWPVLPVVPHAPEPPGEAEPVDEPSLPRWQDRLTFDFNVSDESPVVRGTWITVAQIVSLIVDGQTWADILRSHPELTEEDIRVCLSYATEQENSGPEGFFLP